MPPFLVSARVSLVLRNQSGRRLIVDTSSRERSMKSAKIMIAGTAALIAVHSAVFAQQMLTGTVIKIDRISGTLTVRQTQSGTVGAGNGATPKNSRYRMARC